jgi:hypothetical protein
MLLVFGGAAQAYSAAGPRYTKGDSWTFSVTGDVSSPPGIAPGVFEFNLSGTRTVRVTDLTGGNATTAEVASVKITFSSSLPGITSNVTLYVNSTVTRTPSVSVGTFFVNLSSRNGFSSFTESFRGTYQVTSTVLQDTLLYPLESGHKYTTVAREEATVNLGPPYPVLSVGLTSATDYVAAGASESVSVKAGTFTALPLASWTNTTEVSISRLGEKPLNLSGSHGNLTQMYYAPDVGNYVKIVSYDGSGRAVVREELTSYNYGNAPNRILQVFGDPVFWAGILVVAAAVVVVAALVMRRRRAPAMPPPPSGGMAGPEEAPSPPSEGPLPGQPPGPPPQGRPPEGEERPPSGPT